MPQVVDLNTTVLTITLPSGVTIVEINYYKIHHVYKIPHAPVPSYFLSVQCVKTVFKKRTQELLLIFCLAVIYCDSETWRPVWKTRHFRLCLRFQIMSKSHFKERNYIGAGNYIYLIYFWFNITHWQACVRCISEQVLQNLTCCYTQRRLAAAAAVSRTVKLYWHQSSPSLHGFHNSVMPDLNGRAAEICLFLMY